MIKRTLNFLEYAVTDRLLGFLAEHPYAILACPLLAAGAVIVLIWIDLKRSAK